ncbi:MAG: insulinase family protein [Crocinitomicaceae bacterium]|jgi:zinc protease|nr:insulinase family protein [Crocinitomicaceae bacterium]MDP4724644.1 insulinase family protein [Crocinitomicaceae bacterium]MDP4798863.1 insulinase family protein [Crocinitomicaceae bacterium]MDP4806322.1 insulinase family protein [Crocinitomicaceae bacterium]MDP4869027.1 insulinase family protein [Crocinitomicaceae bacterium]
MKSLYLLLILILTNSVFAQLDRSQRPAAAAAQKINIPASQVFTTSNGVTVILSENHKIPKVSIEMSLGATPRLEGEKAGLSDLAGSLLMSGTSTRSKDQLDREIDFIGANLSASASSMYLSCLTKHLDKGLELMTDVLYNASFPESEVERIRKQNLSGLQSTKADAGEMASNATRAVNFPGHPLGEIMTEASLQNITREDLLRYYKTTFTPQGSYLVVVGDITRAQTEALVTRYFSTWQGAPAYQSELGKGQFDKGNRVIFVKKPGAVQSVVYVTFPIDMRAGHKDQLAMNVLNGILGGGGFGTRLMQNLREDKAFTYGCYSSLNITENGSWMSAGGNFKNAVTDSAITEILKEFAGIINAQVTDEELSLTKNNMAGGFARSLERPQTVARFALNTIKQKLAPDYYQNYLQQLEAITKEDVLRVAQQYFTAKNCHIIVVGNEEILPKLLVFDTDGKIEKLDAFGAPIKETKSADITADQLIEAYAMALTGTTSQKALLKKLKTVKSYSRESEMSSAQIPFVLTSTDYFWNGGNEASKMEMPGMVLQKSYFDGNSGYTFSMQGGREDLTAAEIAAKQKASGFIPELNYKAKGMDYAIKGIELIDGQECYVLYTNDGLAENYDYYSKQTFMKLRSTNIRKMDEEIVETTTNFSDYKVVDGFQFAHAFSMSVGKMTLTGVVKNISVNPKLAIGEDF